MGIDYMTKEMSCIFLTTTVSSVSQHGDCIVHAWMGGVGCVEWGVWSGVCGVGCVEWGLTHVASGKPTKCHNLRLRPAVVKEEEEGSKG